MTKPVYFFSSILFRMTNTTTTITTKYNEHKRIFSLKPMGMCRYRLRPCVLICHLLSVFWVDAPWTTVFVFCVVIEEETDFFREILYPMLRATISFIIESDYMELTSRWNINKNRNKNMSIERKQDPSSPMLSNNYK